MAAILSALYFNLLFIFSDFSDLPLIVGAVAMVMINSSLFLIFQTCL